MFDREGRYGDRFFCTSHYNTIWLYGWKKYDQEVGAAQGAGGGAAPGDALPAGVSSVDAGLKGARTQLGPPTSQQVGSRRALKIKGQLVGLLGEVSQVSGLYRAKDPHQMEERGLAGGALLEEELQLIGAAGGLAPIKSGFYVLFVLLLFAASYIFNPPEIHQFIVANLHLVSVSET